jgi:hypothetical protein
MNVSRRLAAPNGFLMEAILPREEEPLAGKTCCTQMTDPEGCRNRRKSLPCSDQNRYCDFSVCLQRYSRHSPLCCDGSLPSSSRSAVVTLGSVSLLLFKSIKPLVCLHYCFMEFLSSLKRACNATDDICYD